MFLGSPDGAGNMDAVDLRSLDPFRDVANYASLSGIIQSLNPALMAPFAMVDPGMVYGSNEIYPNLSYNAFYGTEEAGSQGNVLTGLSQFVPQLGATSALSGLSQATSLWHTDRPAAIKALLSDLNIPFVTPPVNLKQVAAKAADARYEVAKNVAYNAFQSGDFSALAGYKTVPNPLNPDYEITPAALKALYDQSQSAYPGIPPIEALLPPPTPAGY
jgi:hypothetical protein